MKVYIAGPMRGKPKFNFPKFFKVTEIFRKLGHEVFNPAEKDITKYGKKIMNNAKGDEEKAAQEVGFSLRAALAMDCNWLCKHADAIVMLPGWQKSKGARAEHALAKALGLKIIKIKK